MRYFLALFALAVIGGVAVLGFRGDISRQPPRMAEIFSDLNIQPKLRPQPHKPNRKTKPMQAPSQRADRRCAAR